MQSMQGMHWAHLTVQYGDIFLHVAKRHLAQQNREPLSQLKNVKKVKVNE